MDNIIKINDYLTFAVRDDHMAGVINWLSSVGTNITETLEKYNGPEKKLLDTKYDDIEKCNNVFVNSDLHVHGKIYCDDIVVNKKNTNKLNTME